MESTATTSHWKLVRAVVWNRAAKGGNNTTLTIKKAHTPQANTSFLLENNPNRSTECSERILKLWVSWDRLNTVKAMVRPITGWARSRSKNTRPKV